jgi:hypothetical protein
MMEDSVCAARLVGAARVSGQQRVAQGKSAQPWVNVALISRARVSGRKQVIRAAETQIGQTSVPRAAFGGQTPVAAYAGLVDAESPRAARTCPGLYAAARIRG